MKISADINRREFLKVGGMSFACAALSGIFSNRLFGSEVGVSKDPKAKAIIQVWLGGGPCQMDTFDPKPDAPASFRGPYDKAIPTNVDGILLNPNLENLAKCADKYSLLRSMTHGVNGHETATYLVQTGVPAGGELVYPSVGAVVCYKRATAKMLSDKVPPFVSAMDPIGRFDAEGFLGGAYRPFSASSIVSRKDMKYVPKAAGEEESPRKGKKKTFSKLSEREEEFALMKENRRRELLKEIDSASVEIDPVFSEFNDDRMQAYSMISGEGRKAFDITKEPDSVREKYGSDPVAQQFLLARRLVEGGATYVIINWPRWDTHKKHFETMSEILPILDKALAALINDLSDRGMLDSTMVICGGEFGRTPRILYNPPWFGGRGHFGTAFSWLVAGGGFKGGSVVGQTDSTSSKILSRPIWPWDFNGSVYKLAGIDSGGNLPHPLGCVSKVIPPEILAMPSGGILKEIM